MNTKNPWGERNWGQAPPQRVSPGVPSEWMKQGIYNQVRPEPLPPLSGPTGPPKVGYPNPADRSDLTNSNNDALFDAFDGKTGEEWHNRAGGDGAAEMIRLGYRRRPDGSWALPNKPIPNQATLDRIKSWPLPNGNTGITGIPLGSPSGTKPPSVVSQPGSSGAPNYNRGRKRRTLSALRSY